MSEAVDLRATCARLGLTSAVVTRHGKQVHLWNPSAKQRCKTFCGLAIVDFASDMDSRTVTCARCSEKQAAVSEGGAE